MVRLARAKTGGRLELAEADAMPFDDGEFTAVSCLVAFFRCGAARAPRRVVADSRRATVGRSRRSKRSMEAGHALSSPADRSPLGRITISTDVIAQIVAETALECYGVVGMKGSLRGRLARGRARTRGIGIRRDGDEVTVDLHVVVEYGLNLAEVASSVRRRVAYEVERLTGLPVRAVEVHVDDVRTGG
jgi:uncharacterized alkaline shock family protein YloU